LFRTLILLLGSALLVGLSLAAAQTGATKPAPATAAPAEAKPAPPAPSLPLAPAVRGFFEILFSGGLLGIAIMLVLIGLSMTAFYLVIENGLSIRESELLPEELANQVRARIVEGNYDAATALCRQQPGFLAFILQQGLSEVGSGWSDVEKALEEALAEQAAKLFRKVEYLSVIGNIAPMVGLLGTVTGMLLSFKMVAESQTKAGPSELADGIYQALVTTVVGLIIAIPAMGAFAWFRNRADEIVAQGAFLVQHTFAPLKRAEKANPPSVPPAPPVGRSP